MNTTLLALILTVITGVHFGMLLALLGGQLEARKFLLALVQGELVRMKERLGPAEFDRLAREFAEKQARR